MRTQQQYIEAALKTERTPKTIQYSRRELIGALSLFVAAGDLLDQIKKRVFLGKAIDERVREEHLVALTRALEYFKSGNQPAETIKVDSRQAHALMGAATEGAELAEALLKAVQNKGEIDVVNVNEEFGDHDWYKFLWLDASGSDETTIRERVLAKLEDRARRSGGDLINRDRVAERAILEGKSVPPAPVSIVDAYSDGMSRVPSDSWLRNSPLIGGEQAASSPAIVGIDLASPE